MKNNIKRIDLNLLVVLEALYDEQSVTRAADRLALTQPTVSGMLKRLRSIFDDDLFVLCGWLPFCKSFFVIDALSEAVLCSAC